MTAVRGSILILTLWVLIILALLSAGISYRASGDIRISRYESSNLKGLYLAKAGILKILADISKDTNSYDSLNEGWNRDEARPNELKFGDSAVFYGASDEESRLNLNSSNLKKENLIRLGIQDELSQAVIDYKLKKQDKGFEFMEELFLIDGMTREIYSSIESDVTIYRGTEPKVNINTAGENTLRSIIGDEILAGKVLEYRRGEDDLEGTEDDGIFKADSDISVIEGLNPALFNVKSNSFRAWSASSSTEDKKIIKKITAVADRDSRIFYWRED